MSKIILCILFVLICSSFGLFEVTNSTKSKDAEYAEIHIFRPKQYQGGTIVFQIQVNDNTIARISNGSRIIYRIYNEGSVDFKLKASVFNSKSINFGIVKGQKYYLRAGYGDGFGSKLSFIPLSEQEGKTQFSNLSSFGNKKIKIFNEDESKTVVRNEEIFSEKVAEFETNEINQKDNGPTMAWISPERQESRTDISTFSIQLCLKSEAEVFDLNVKLNGVLVDERNKIVPLDKKCAYTYINNIELVDEKNVIEITIKDRFGESTFNRILYFKERKKIYRGLALVIGNSDYFEATNLPNPKNDANDMSKALRKLGFEVMEFSNLGQDEMNRAMGNFILKLENYKTGIFFYAGHGIQHDGQNYLIPVDAAFQSANDIDTKCVATGGLLTKMELMDLETSVLILDACRNNPFKGLVTGVADISAGLTGTDAPAGSIVAFATAPGKTASDGVGSNGLYTQEILKNIYKQDLKVEDLFKRVRINVMNQSKNQQIPWETSSLVKDFYFNPA